MREILFRGKTKEDGKWVYGGIFFFNGATFIVCEEKIGLPKVKEVEETSIGQFTNILDKNGTKVFEGDIISYFSIWYGRDIFATVEYCEGYPPYMCRTMLSPAPYPLMYRCEDGDFRVVGNIIDDPNILFSEQNC